MNQQKHFKTLKLLSLVFIILFSTACSMFVSESELIRLKTELQGFELGIIDSLNKTNIDYIIFSSEPRNLSVSKNSILYIITKFDGKNYRIEKFDLYRKYKGYPYLHPKTYDLIKNMVKCFKSDTVNIIDNYEAPVYYKIIIYINSKSYIIETNVDSKLVEQNIDIYEFMKSFRARLLECEIKGLFYK